MTKRVRSRWTTAATAGRISTRTRAGLTSGWSKAIVTGSPIRTAPGCWVTRRSLGGGEPTVQRPPSRTRRHAPASRARLTAPPMVDKGNARPRTPTTAATGTDGIGHLLCKPGTYHVSGSVAEQKDVSIEDVRLAGNLMTRFLA